ncbi:MAG: DUF349 domain-containing protein [Pseudomonadota bacterium]
MWHKLFRPKWRHRNRDIRAEAIQQLPVDDPGFVAAVRQDPDTGIRRQALRRVTDRQLLQDIAESDSDASVSRAANRRLWYLLAQSDDAASIQQTLALLQQRGNPGLAEYMIRHSRSTMLRQQLLDAIRGPALLAEIALTDADTAIRLQALQRITRLSTLKRIAREARGKNKRVARRARELVEEQTLLQELPQLQQQLCDDIEQLASLQQPDHTTLHRLDQQWQKVGATAPEALKSRFSHARSQIRDAIEASRDSKAQLDRQRELCEQSEALLHDLEQQVNAPSLNLNEVEAAEWMLASSWQQLQQELGLLNPALEARFSESQQTLARRRRQIEQHRQLHAQQLAMIAEMQNLADDHRKLTAGGIKEIETRWQAQTPKPAAGMVKHFQQHLSRANQHLQANIASAAKLETELDARLQQLETALEQGQLNAAGAARSKAQQTMERLEKLAPARLKQRKSNFHRLLGRYAELHDWQRYGSDHVREELLGEMQRLIDSGLPPRELANNVRDLRNQWRKLDRKGGPAPEALWNNFNTVAEQAYAPVVAAQQRHQQQQQESAQQRTEFCDRLAGEYAQIDWSNPDWPAIDRRIQDVRTQWRKLGGVDSSSWKRLNQHFIDTIKPFEARLSEVRKAEKLRRERLIRQVQRLADDPDIDIAVEQTKSAQAEWKPLVSAGRQMEQQLWKQFKAAADAVFARRSAIQQSELQEEQANAAAKQAICEQLQQLKSTADGGWSAARKERDRLAAEWKTIGPAPRHQYKSLQQQFARLKRAFDEAEKAALNQQSRNQLELLLQQAELCDQMEQQLCGEGAADNALHERWTALPEVQGGAESRMQRRYQRILDASAKGGNTIDQLCAQQQENLDRSQQLCLEMELLLDIDSPEAFHDQRREWQLRHLSSAMTGGLAQNGNASSSVRRLVEESCANGPLPPEAAASIRERERNIIAAIQVQ